MAASGFAALGYQIVWTQQASLWLGHEAAGVFAVVGAFFAGLSLGAFALSARIERSRVPWRWYAGCELLIALWGIALAAFLEPASSAMLSWIGPAPSPLRHWSVAFLGTALLLLPATVAMGATMPAMESALGRRHDGGRVIAWLYAANTAGAVAGVLAAAFVLVPGLGLLRTALVCAALNVLCAGFAATLGRRSAPSVAVPAVVSPGSRGVLVTLLFTGMLGIGYEVLVMRVLTQVTENTVYTFALLLAVYLVATAAGAALFAGYAAVRRDPGFVQQRVLLLTLAVACAIGASGLAVVPEVKRLVALLFGTGVGGALSAEAAVAVWAFLIPALPMGALFSLLVSRARQSGAGVGRAVAVNTLGAALAPAVFGVMLAPWLSTKFALLAVAAGYLILCGARAWSSPATWGGVAVIAVVAVWSPPLVIVDVPDGGRVVSHVQGVLSSVSIVEDAQGVATLHIDNRQQEGSSATLLADARQAVLPLLLHPAPARALFLGLGTGVTSAAAARERGLQVTAVELLPEVIDASAWFLERLEQRLPGPRPEIVHADARRFVRSTEQRFDVIVSDNFHPARSGSASLYTVEHFRAVRERLAPGGVFCQWLPLHQMDLDTLRSIVASFVAVYPRAWALLATYSLETPTIGLVALRDGERLDIAQVRERIARAALPGGAAAFGVPDDLALLGAVVADTASLGRFAGDAPRNTDDHPVVAYRAPRLTYAADSQPADRLLSLMASVQASPSDVLDAQSPSAESALAARIEAYAAARNRFLQAGVGVRPSGDVRRMLDQVRDPLLSVLRTSPAFRPAYDPLLRMAGALAEDAPGDAAALLRALRDVAPQRPEADRMLKTLEAAGGR